MRRMRAKTIFSISHLSACSFKRVHPWRRGFETVNNMRFLNSSSSSSSAAQSTPTTHVSLVAHRRHQTSLSSSSSSYYSTKSPLNTNSTVKLLCKAKRNTHHGRTHPGPLVFKGPTFLAMDCVFGGRVRLQYRAATLSAPKIFCFGFVRTCSSVASLVPSSLGSLVPRAPSTLVVTSQLTHSNAPQKSEEWFALRKDKLTTSTFSTALGFWKGNRRNELWQEKVFAPEGDSFSKAAKAAMNWGVMNENAAVERYKSITGRDVSFLGFAVHAEEKFKWLGASPDGLLGECPGGGILEVKCPYNKGKPELGLPWSRVPFYYMPQVQGQMEILDREWVDLYCWTPNGSTIFRVCRDREYWKLINGVLREFWWDNVIPAKELMSLGKEEDAKALKPSPTHRQTGLVIVKSMQLAGESKLLCREIAGHLEFFS